MRRFAELTIGFSVSLLTISPALAQIPTPTSTPSSADLDVNGCIDSCDLIIFLQAWHETEKAVPGVLLVPELISTSATADLDGNGRIDFRDLLLFLMGWHEDVHVVPTLTSTPTETADATPTPTSTILCASIEMVTLPTGSFVMGNTGSERDQSCPCSNCTCEEPSHTVNINYSFQMGKYEITNEQYACALNWANLRGYLRNSSDGAYTGGSVYQDGRLLIYVDDAYCDIIYSVTQFVPRSRNDQMMSNHPVLFVNWYGAIAFCNWLSEMNGLTPAYDLTTWALINSQGGGYRLPSEAEWEYACRGSESNPHRYDPFSFGDDPSIDLTSCNFSSILNNYMVWCGSQAPWTVAVGSKIPNDYGLYDMHGNVWEWCEDWYHPDYVGAPTDGSAWLVKPPWNPSRLRRGGYYFMPPQYCRSSYRQSSNPGVMDNTLGFRLARNP
jgi:formylglycine-generating enzyme required for sulfatase activity